MTKPTIAQLKSRLHFSASALKTYLQCPWKFRLQYVEGAEPEFRPSGMVLGRAVHQALARTHWLGKTRIDSTTRPATRPAAPNRFFVITRQLFGDNLG